MKEFKDKYNCASNRLKEFDYALESWYYITICTKNKVNYFGNIEEDQIRLNPCGQIAFDLWKKLPNDLPVLIDEFIIMPNHIHGIVIIDRRDLIHQVSKKMDDTKDLINQISTKENNNWTLMRQKGTSLGKVIRYYKAKVSKRIHSEVNKTFAWQSNYYDHIIRNEEDLRRIREYIHYNPLKSM